MRSDRQRRWTFVVGLFFAVSFASVWPQGEVLAKSRANCKALGIDARASLPFMRTAEPNAKRCHTRTSHGFPIPDPTCTPGAVNPTVTLGILRNPTFRTSCLRNGASTARQKARTYLWYNFRHPARNTGASQTCELDHLVSLELGGADTLDNIWPQCGPKNVALRKRYFKEKDIVENYLTAQVRAGKMSLASVQRGIAADWTRYLDRAVKACPSGRCR